MAWHRNGKLERFHGTIKDECIRSGVPLSLDDARGMVEKYIAPADKLAGKELEKLKERDIKLEEARELRKQKRQQAFPRTNHSGETGLTLDQAA